MKILQVVTHVGGGGDWTVVRTLAEGLIERGHTVYVNGHQDPRFPAAARQLDLSLNAGPVRFVRSAAEVARTLGGGLDVIHAHSPKTLLWGRLVSILSGKRIRVIMSYHWPVNEGYLRRLVKRCNFMLADLLHSVSADVNQDLVERYAVPLPRLRVAAPGVNAHYFQPIDDERRSALRKKYGIPGSAVLLGFIGRLDTEKNTDWIVSYVNAHSDLHLAVAGNGPCLELLRERAGDRVHFLGRINDPANFFNMIDLNVLPSSYEAFGLTVVEAAFCGTPTLRSNVEGAQEQIEPDVSGFVFDIAVAESGLHAALDEVLARDRVALRQVGQAARNRMMPRFSVAHFIDQVEEMYHR